MDDPKSPPRSLVTAGSTREMIDEVRDWGNIFEGDTGLGIALALAQWGAVDLLTSNARHLERVSERRSPHAVTPLLYRSHADLRAALENRFSTTAYDAVIMTSAVSDYRPTGVYEIASRSAGPEPGTEQWLVRAVPGPKVKSDFPHIAVAAARTEKLIDLIRPEFGHRGLLVKFKLEVGLSHQELIAVARKSRQACQADFVVANTLDMARGDTRGAYLIDDEICEWIPRDELGARLASLVASVPSRAIGASKSAAEGPREDSSIHRCRS